MLLLLPANSFSSLPRIAYRELGHENIEQGGVRLTPTILRVTPLPNKEDGGVYQGRQRMIATEGVYEKGMRRVVDLE